jgi:hypothetical protein
MILDVTRLQALHAALIAAHREPQSCGHPKSDLRICSDCGTVQYAACRPSPRGWVLPVCCFHAVVAQSLMVTESAPCAAVTSMQGVKPGSGQVNQVAVPASSLKRVSATEWTPRHRCPLCAGPTCPNDHGGITCPDCAVHAGGETDEQLIARRARHLRERGR